MARLLPGSLPLGGSNWRVSASWPSAASLDSSLGATAVTFSGSANSPLDGFLSVMHAGTAKVSGYCASRADTRLCPPTGFTSTSTGCLERASAAFSASASTSACSSWGRMMSGRKLPITPLSSAYAVSISLFTSMWSNTMPPPSTFFLPTHFLAASICWVATSMRIATSSSLSVSQALRRLLYSSSEMGARKMERQSMLASFSKVALSTSSSNRGKRPLMITSLMASFVTPMRCVSMLCTKSSLWCSSSRPSATAASNSESVRAIGSG
mmetsp:Transcript_28570/g.77063  ORF Transcript_28570/g.77063 Transcript_28570/m.77063 type:complete len:268 (-) Transcript_28570:2294-3097(-)